MIRFDLILIFRDRAENVWWYWHTPEEAVNWASVTFKEVKQIQVAWNTGAGLKIQAWTPEGRSLGEPIVHEKRWTCLEMD